MDAPVTPGSDAGFSLIELMIAVTILSVLTVSVSLGVNRPRGATQDWARFQAVHDRLRERAALSQQVLGLALSPDGYQRMRRTDGVWVPEGDPVAWRDRVAVLAPLDRRFPAAFLPSGQATAMRLRFGPAETARICESDGWNKVSCVAR